MDDGSNTEAEPWLNAASKLLTSGVSEAWNVLLNPSKKLVYDDELRFLQFGHVNPLGQQHYQHQQPQTLFMQTPLKETQSLFVRSPRKNKDGKDALKGEQLCLHNYSAGSNWTRQINQKEPIGVSQINQTEYSRIEPTQSATQSEGPENDSTPASLSTLSEGPKNDSTLASQSTQSEGLTFWTARPHCYSCFEYPKVYENGTLRCQTKDCRKTFQAAVIPSLETEPSGVNEDYTLRFQAKNCRRAYHAVAIPSPPVNGNDPNFRCCGFFPIERTGNFPSWSPISTMFACPDNKNDGKQKIPKKSAPRVFYDERDTYVEISDSSGVEEQVDGLLTELKWKQSLLLENDVKQHENEGIRLSVAEIRELAYDAEDVIKDFVLRIVSKKEGGISGCIKISTCILIEGWTLHKTRSKIEEIFEKILNLVRRFQAYVVMGLKDGDGPSYSIARRELRNPNDFC
ncbi:CC-NBS-LRR class disease resistance protein [Hibiscus syriacus]|uniref:CC-NBS-LRR class disease resistance protein n=1 Tax=Hibiscus syriacus TaxID=106335 RepID=A0A6A2WP35_HIBSY|nr:CC-NBS-LRR class disease resistance protein [Hibiscus syriacus]